MIKKRFVQILAFLLAVALILPGCGKTQKESSNATTTTQPVQQKAPDKISIFFETAGQTIPNDFSYTNNDYWKEICKLANIEVTDLTVPAYADNKAKFNLLMSSGTIPDVVHYADFAEMSRYGKEGAFLEMSDLIQKSKIMSQRYTQEQINGMKADDGKIYTVRSLPTDDGWHMAVRYDLLIELGYTKLPTTLNDWVDAMKKLKVKYPDSIPYTTAGMDNYAEFIFEPYGMDTGKGWQYYNGKISNVLENPNLKDAISFGKQLYTDGLLDKEFATNKVQDYNDKRVAKNVLAAALNLGSLGNTIDMYAKAGNTKAILVPAPFPVAIQNIDPYAKYIVPSLFGGACISISSKTQQKEAAFRFIETLLTDDVKNMFIYGREGNEYTVANGQKVFDPVKQVETQWRAMYGLMFYYNPIEKTRLKCEMNIMAINADNAVKDKYKSTFFTYFDDIYKSEYKKVKPNPMSVISLSTDALSQSTECIANQKSLIMKAIMNQITIDDFMKQAADLVKKYQSVTDDYTKKLPAAKAVVGIQ